MEVPTEAVNTLSDTAWGAIWIITVVSMGSAITYLTVYIRSLNRMMREIGEKRTQDAKDSATESQKLVRELLEAMNKSVRAVDDLGRKVCESNRNTIDLIQRLLSGGS